MNLKKIYMKIYEKIDWVGLWNALQLYGLGGRQLKGMKSFYVNSIAWEILIGFLFKYDYMRDV